MADISELYTVDDLDDMLVVQAPASDSSLAESVDTNPSDTQAISTHFSFTDSEEKDEDNSSTTVTAHTISERSDESETELYQTDTFNSLTSDRSVTSDVPASDTEDKHDSYSSYTSDWTGDNTTTRTPSYSFSTTTYDEDSERRALRRYCRARLAAVRRGAATRRERTPSPPPADPKTETYCSRKVEELKRRLRKPEVHADEPKQTTSSHVYLERTRPHVTVPQAFMDRARISCVLNKMKDMAREEDLYSESCDQCRAVKGEGAERDYVRFRVENVRSRMIDEQMADRMYQDPMMMYAELLSGLPNPRERSKNIWQQLLKPLEDV